MCANANPDLHNQDSISGHGTGFTLQRDSSYSPQPAHVDNYEYPYCQDINKYDKQMKIGQGTFGEVFYAKCRRTQRNVALKKVKMELEKEGFPITALREIRILQLLRHENVVRLYEICRSKPTPYNRERGSIYMVFEFCEHDLAGLLSNPEVKFPVEEIKDIIRQLFRAISYLHSNNVLHRDMKASNIFITREGRLKLGDFGLARAIAASKMQPAKYTNRVVTLWYRAPELLLGDRSYSFPIDLWGVGCIMAEMWIRSPILQGTIETHQLTLICCLCGSINTRVWPDVERLELFSKMIFKDETRKVVERLTPKVGNRYAVDLIDKLLVLGEYLQECLVYNLAFNYSLKSSLLHVQRCSCNSKSHFA